MLTRMTADRHGTDTVFYCGVVRGFVRGFVRGNQPGKARGIVQGILRALAILLLVGIADAAMQPQSAAATAGSSYDLRVRPRVCVVLGDESSCTMLMAVTWSAPVQSDVCLKLAQEAEVLQCWEQQRVGEYEFEFRHGSNAVVQLLDAVSNAVLSEAEVSVVSRDLRDSRRRRRHVWSII